MYTDIGLSSSAPFDNAVWGQLLTTWSPTEDGAAEQIFSLRLCHTYCYMFRPLWECTVQDITRAAILEHFEHKKEASKWVIAAPTRRLYKLYSIISMSVIVDRYSTFIYYNAKWCYCQPPINDKEKNFVKGARVHDRKGALPLTKLFSFTQWFWGGLSARPCLLFVQFLLLLGYVEQ